MIQSKPGQPGFQSPPAVPEAGESIQFSAHATEQPEAAISSGRSGVSVRSRKLAPAKEAPITRPAIRATPVEKDSNWLKPDLMRAAIFGAAGVVLLFIGSDTFVVLGTLSLMVGLIFAIKWLLRDKK